MTLVHKTISYPKGAGLGTAAILKIAFPVNFFLHIVLIYDEPIHNTKMVERPFFVEDGISNTININTITVSYNQLALFSFSEILLYVLSLTSLLLSLCVIFMY